MTAVDSMLRWFRSEDRLGPIPKLRLKFPTSGWEYRRAPLPPQPPWLAKLDAAGIPRTLNYPSTTLGRVLDQTADRYGDDPALVYHYDRCNYRELLARTNRLAGALASLGVGKGDRVLLTLPNCPEYVASFFAIQKLGALVVNAGPLVGSDDLSHIIHLTNPHVVIGLDLQAASLDRIGRGTGIEHFIWVTLQTYQSPFKRLGYQIKLWHEYEKHSSAARHHALANLLERAAARPPTILSDPNDIAVLQPTGGTTGTPKLAELSHHSLLANTMQVSLWVNTRMAQETILVVLPMFHVYGLTTCLLTGILSASRLVLLTRFGAAETLEHLRDHRVTMFPLVPAICDALSNEIEAAQQPVGLSSLRLCISGAAPLPPAVAERFEKLTSSKIIEGYGLSEASPVTHANLPGDRRRGTIGIPMPDTHCRIVDWDDPDKEVPPGESGELLVSGPQLMRGYFADADQTRRVLTTDAQGRTWLHTGDVAMMQPEGYFVILDRKKDMIIRSGLKIFPGRVEKVLQSHPQVIEAAVIGRADAVHTQVVMAYIVARVPAEQRESLVGDLRKLCREHLAPYEVPADFRFVDALPRSPLGKLLKKDLLSEAPQPGSQQPGRNGNGHTNGHSENGNGVSPMPEQNAESPLTASEKPSL
jgi:long-chain acyl-CoA synthetase